MSIESVVVAPNPDRSELLVERSIIHADTPLKFSETTSMDTFAYTNEGSINSRVEIFKTHVQKIV